jgi:hypothetical protein
MIGTERSWMLLCVGGKTRGAVRVCLELFCSTFFFQEKKVENNH